jgi:hypothetical protein
MDEIPFFNGLMTDRYCGEIVLRFVHKLKLDGGYLLIDEAQSIRPSPTLSCQAPDNFVIFGEALFGNNGTS